MAVPPRAKAGFSVCFSSAILCLLLSLKSEMNIIRRYHHLSLYIWRNLCLCVIHISLWSHARSDLRYSGKAGINQIFQSDQKKTFPNFSIDLVQIYSKVGSNFHYMCPKFVFHMIFITIVFKTKKLRRFMNVRTF